jgi:hypothetical protein
MNWSKLAQDVRARGWNEENFRAFRRKLRNLIAQRVPAHLRDEVEAFVVSRLALHFAEYRHPATVVRLAVDRECARLTQRAARFVPLEAVEDGDDLG